MPFAVTILIHIRRDAWDLLWCLSNVIRIATYTAMNCGRKQVWSVLAAMGQVAVTKRVENRRCGRFWLIAWSQKQAFLISVHFLAPVSHGRLNEAEGLFIQTRLNSIRLYLGSEASDLGYDIIFWKYPFKYRCTGCPEGSVTTSFHPRAMPIHYFERGSDWLVPITCITAHRLYY
jgi:hypothetical protein